MIGLTLNAWLLNLLLLHLRVLNFQLLESAGLVEVSQ